MTTTREKKRASIYYVDNKKFYEKIKEYIYKCRDAKEEGKDFPKIPDYLGICFQKIANKLATLPRYSGYSYKEEMIEDGIENCIRYIKSFDPDKSNNPFAYFTQTVKNSFWHRINVERKEQYVKWKSLETLTLTSDTFNAIDKEGYSVSIEMHDNMQRFIGEYEIAINEKRDKVKKKKTLKGGIFDIDEEEEINNE